MSPSNSHGILRPDRLEAAQKLVAALAAPRVRARHRLEFVHGPAKAEAYIEPAAREHVQGGELLGQHHGSVVRHDQHARQSVLIAQPRETLGYIDWVVQRLLYAVSAERLPAPARSAWRKSFER